MNDDAALLLAFDATMHFSSDQAYVRAVGLHRTNLLQLTQHQPFQGKNFVQLLEFLSPAVNSLSYLAILYALRDFSGFPAEQRGVATINFFTSFDPRQIRFAGDWFTGYLKHVISSSFILPDDVKAGLLATAILKIDPTGSMLTAAHVELVHLALETDNADAAFGVLDKHIVYYPGMDTDNTGGRNANGKPLCDMSLPPPDYITEETGLTTCLDVQAVLEYDFLSGVLFLTRSQWNRARAAFERVITHPTRDGGVSKIMTEAYDKWLLVSLLVNGQTPQVPANAGAYAKKAYETMSKPYQALAVHFDAMTAIELKEEVETHVQRWHDDRNSGLVQEVLATHQKWQIIKLRNTFSKVSLSQIRETTCSAETGKALPSDGDVERLVQAMIDSKMLNGIIVKPEGKPAYLEYLAEEEELSEAEYNKEVAATMARLKELEAIYRSTNSRLSTNPYWLKHIIREQKREKDNSGQYNASNFEGDDEDLMTDVVPAVM